MTRLSERVLAGRAMIKPLVLYGEDLAEAADTISDLVEAAADVIRWFEKWQGKTANQEAALENLRALVAKANGQ